MKQAGMHKLSILVAVVIVLAGCGIVSESSPGDKKAEGEYAIPVKVTRRAL